MDSNTEYKPLRSWDDLKAAVERCRNYDKGLIGRRVVIVDCARGIKGAAGIIARACERADIDWLAAARQTLGRRL